MALAVGAISEAADSLEEAAAERRRRGAGGARARASPSSRGGRSTPRRPGLRGDRPRLDQGGRDGGADAGRPRALHRRPPGLRRRAHRGGVRPPGALPRRHLVPDARRPRRARTSSSACTASWPRSAPARWRSTPDVHDRLMALVSHLPHVLAGALVNQAADTAPGGREALRSAGPSFVDLTRVAGSNPPLWADILLANAAAVLRGAARLLGAPRRRRGGPRARRPRVAARLRRPTPAEARGRLRRGRGPRAGRRDPGDRRRPQPAGRDLRDRHRPRARPHQHRGPQPAARAARRRGRAGAAASESPAAAQEAVRLVGERGYRAREARA